MRKESLFKKGDLAVAGLLLLLAGAFALSGGTSRTQAARFARIRDGGNAVLTIDLNALPGPKEYELQSGGISLVVEAQTGRARVKSSTCPDQICVRTGWLTRPGSAAACVPARVTVELEGVPETDVILR